MRLSESGKFYVAYASGRHADYNVNILVERIACMSYRMFI